MAKTDTSHRIEEFAEDLGKLLGTARAKADGWLAQRQAIVKQLTQLRDETTKLLTDLGQQTERAVRAGWSAYAGKAGTRGPRRSKGSGRKRRKMSAAARAKISEAQKKRWAKQRAASKK